MVKLFKQISDIEYFTGSKIIYGFKNAMDNYAGKSSRL